jgi:hypothetical protein
MSQRVQSKFIENSVIILPGEPVEPLVGNLGTDGTFTSFSEL